MTLVNLVHVAILITLSIITVCMVVNYDSLLSRFSSLLMEFGDHFLFVFLDTFGDDVVFESADVANVDDVIGFIEMFDECGDRNFAFGAITVALPVPKTEIEKAQVVS